MKYKRSIPYFNALLKASSSSRKTILRNFPQFVVDDLLEILYNIVLGRVNIGKRRQNLEKHRKVLLDIANTKNKIKQRGIIYKQTGGFLGTLIPIVTSLLGKFI